LSQAAWSAEPGKLRAGTAKIDITPPVGFAMWGYGSRHDQPSVGVLEPLHARVLVLEGGSTRIALVSLDLGRPPVRDSFERLRKRVARSAKIDVLLLAASHTHHGPVLELDAWPTKEKPYVQTLEESLGTAIEKAAASLVPARWSAASGHVPANRNRHSRQPVKPTDAELVVLRVEDDTGKALAHVVNFAAHPVMLPVADRRFSPDYAGGLASAIEKARGGVCLFMQGASGDLSPAPARGETPHDFGAGLGRKALALCADVKSKTTAAPRFRERDFTFAKRIDPSLPWVRIAYGLAFFPELIDFYEREYRGGVRPRMTSILLDDDVGLVAVSGEFFCMHAVRLKERARLKHLLFVTCCNDYHQYFPTIEAVAEGGYGASEVVAPVEVGAGERMMDRALTDLYVLRGRVLEFGR
jgi:hypothetical protein